MLPHERISRSAESEDAVTTTDSLNAIAARNAAIRIDIDAAILDAERLWEVASEDRKGWALIVLARLRTMRADNESVARLLEAMQ